MFSVVTTVCHLLLNRTFANMNELIADYESGALHPADVKPALAKAINQILQVCILAKRIDRFF